MGDRCNVVISTEAVAGKTLAEAIENQVVIYAHWSGENSTRNVRDVLKRGARLDDAPYLARIVLCQFMVRACGTKPTDEDIVRVVREETSFGISSGVICDNERPILVLDTAEAKVYKFDGNSGGLKPSQEWTFNEFAALNDKACEAILRDEESEAA